MHILFSFHLKQTCTCTYKQIWNESMIIWQNLLYTNAHLYTDILRFFYLYSCSCKHDWSQFYLLFQTRSIFSKVWIIFLSLWLHFSPSTDLFYVLRWHSSFLLCNLHLGVIHHAHIAQKWHFIDFMGHVGAEPRQSYTTISAVIVCPCC